MTTPPPVMSRKTKKTKKKKKKEEKVAHADAPKLDWRVVDDVPAGFFFIFAIFFLVELMASIWNDCVISDGPFLKR